MVTFSIIRGFMSEAKRVGTPLARRIRNAVIREIYMDIFTDDPSQPASRRHFIQWLRNGLQANPVDNGLPGFVEWPFGNVTLDDSFAAESEGIG